MEVGETCNGCYYLDYYAGYSYCCLSEPDVDVDGFCSSYITLDELDNVSQ